MLSWRRDRKALIGCWIFDGMPDWLVRELAGDAILALTACEYLTLVVVLSIFLLFVSYCIFVDGLL